MTVNPSYLFGTVRLIGNYGHGPLSERRGIIGTGFVVSLPSEAHPEVRYGYLVTAAHVLKDQTKIEVQFQDPKGGLLEPVTFSDWRYPLPKVDLALHLIMIQAPLYGTWLERHALADSSDIALGSPIYYIGIQVGIDRAMVRTGTIGAVSQEGLPLGEFDYPAHLIDCRSYGGFSGSPVFLHLDLPTLVPEPRSWDVGTSDEVGDRPTGLMAHYAFLAGMFTAHLTDTGRDDTLDADGAASRYGVGVMLRIDEIREAFMTDELRSEREKFDARISEDKAKPKLTGASRSGVGLPDFTRDDFMRDLTKVTRPEASPEQEG